ncbi:hypothetical protein LCGC14_0424670 [marine sediment metagenome]|uniref:Uncharacterized protein n=1 Tax=marine sediment metagenome TaxID=412755 RepID=A0A0F9SPT8_9ZZZZ
MKNAAKALALLVTGAAIGGGTVTLAAPDIAYHDRAYSQVLTRDVRVYRDELARAANWTGSLDDVRKACIESNGEKSSVVVRGKNYAPKADVPDGVKLIKE